MFQFPPKTLYGDLLKTYIKGSATNENFEPRRQEEIIKIIILFQPSATAGKRKKRSTVEAVEEVINHTDGLKNSKINAHQSGEMNFVFINYISFTKR